MRDRMLTRLREKLRELNLSGFIVPHTDEYQNEYIPAYAERLAWLTGFTGSAGTAIILEQKAAIFVDGRYTLQVADQVDAACFSIHNSGDVSPWGWLKAQIRPTDRVGYDPRLHTPSDLQRYREACDFVGSQVIPCDPNPIDSVWSEQPPRPLGLVHPHPREFSGETTQEKREKIVQAFRDEHIHAAIITAPDSIAWLLNIRGSDVPYTPLPLSQAILYETGRVALFIESDKISPSLPVHLGEDVALQSPEDFAVALRQLGASKHRVLCDPLKTNSWVFSILEGSGAVIVRGEDPCALPKACKNRVEVEGAIAAHRRDGVAVCQFLSWLAKESVQEQITEMEAAAYLDECRKKQPCWQDSSFPTISGAGSNGAIVHYHATPETNRRLQLGELYLIDSGGQYSDGTTDITRTVAIGNPSRDQQEHYTRVLQGHIALATAQFPEGTTGSQLDALARNPLWGIGLDFDHGTGHGVGSYLGVHEGPQRISKAGNTVNLRPGMILSNEPGYYKKGAYGIRLENLVVVVPRESGHQSQRAFLGFETLTVVPFDRSLILVALLDERERDWVNTYHERVWEELHELVDPDTRTWLRDATQPVE